MNQKEKINKNSFFKNTIVLKSNFNDKVPKISFHIIFKYIVCKNINSCKQLYLELKKNLNSHKFFSYVDGRVYHETCFRLCYNKKKGIDNILLPFKIKIDIDNVNYDTKICDYVNDDFESEHLKKKNIE